MNKTTKITIREDQPTAISSTAYKANLNSMGFNMDYLQKHDHKLYLRVIRLYEEACKVNG
jgi:hypothetical protein